MDKSTCTNAGSDISRDLTICMFKEGWMKVPVEVAVAIKGGVARGNNQDEGSI